MTSEARLREVVAVYQRAKADRCSVHGAIARYFGTSQMDAKAMIKEARDKAFLTTYPTERTDGGE